MWTSQTFDGTRSTQHRSCYCFIWSCVRSMEFILEIRKKLRINSMILMSHSSFIIVFISRTSQIFCTTLNEKRFVME